MKISKFPKDFPAIESQLIYYEAFVGMGEFRRWHVGSADPTEIF